MDPAIAGLLGAVVGGVASLLGSLLSNWLAIRKERERWLLDREDEYDRWLRERLQEIYTNSLNYLSRMLRSSHVKFEDSEPVGVMSSEHMREMFTDFSEAQKWLGMLAVYHPAKRGNDPFTDEFKEFIRQVTRFSSEDFPNLARAKHMQQQVITLAATDPRLQNPLGR